MRHTAKAESPQRIALLLAALALGLAATSAAAEVEGVTDKEVILGMSTALSGPLKDYGQQMRIGFESAFSAQNKAGGVHGRKLRLVVLDDGYEPERTKVAMRQLLEKQKVFAVVGNVGTPTAAVSVPYVGEKGVLFFAPLTGADFLRNDPPDRFVFNYRASYWEEMATAVKYLVDVRGIKPNQIAVFAQNDSYGEAGWEGVAHMMRKYKRDPAQVLRVSYKRNTTDVAEAVRVIKANAPKVRAVVMASTSKATARFIQKIKEENLDLVLATISGVNSSELAEQLMLLGPRHAEGVIVTQVVPLPTSRASAILKYQQDLSLYAPAEKPGFISLEGYVAANLLVQGLQRTGRNLTTDTLITALESVKNLDIGIGATLSFGPSEHQASHKVWLTGLDGQGVYRAIHFE
jgi:ABC-type branched-subunit amino acid transport system substrate-binding protein